ncbi:MAG TPA: hypothetical protein VJB16_07185 [archaeon]|nr:hypothetical protein [archaeon]
MLSEALESAQSIPELFAVVKAVVASTAQRQRNGLRVGFSELGIGPWGFVGAYHPLGSDLIVMNKTLLRRVAEQEPSLFRHYAFNLLLHEYLHALGVVDEAAARVLASNIALATLGEEHPATAIADGFLHGGAAVNIPSHIEQIMPLDLPQRIGWDGGSA